MRSISRPLRLKKCKEKLKKYIGFSMKFASLNRIFYQFHFSQTRKIQVSPLPCCHVFILYKQVSYVVPLEILREACVNVYNRTRNIIGTQEGNRRLRIGAGGDWSRRIDV